MRHVVVMFATSYPRFPGDGVGSFMEPIAKGVAARGHDVHLVAPWHPAITRAKREDGVAFHFFKYAPLPSLNVFGYAAGLRADTALKAAAWMATPAAVLAGWFKTLRVCQKTRATIVHAHWVVPGGVIAGLAAGRRPLVVSLHGSDVFVAERQPVARQAARRVFARSAWVTACSEDLRRRAVSLGANPARTETIPYGVDTTRFSPRESDVIEVRRKQHLEDEPVVFTAGRLVRKKGFEYLIDAVLRLAQTIPRLRLLIAGDGDLRGELEARASLSGGVVRLLGNQPQDEIARLAAAATVIAVPSVHDDAGNVDGLPNFALEALASGTPVVATRVGGLPEAIIDNVSGVLVDERDPVALADAIRALLAEPERARQIGAEGRRRVDTVFGWPRVAERLEQIYDRVARPAAVRG